NGAWTNLFIGVARANVVLDGIANTSFASKATVTAELHALRAWYYFGLLDMFGNVPIATDAAIVARPQASRDSVFRFVEAELKAARADLPATWSADMNGRLTQGAIDAMLASLYVNAQVFTGTVSATGLAPGAARWQDAFDPADQRTQIFLAGPQFNVLTGQPVTDRQGNPLVFTPAIPDVTAATEGAGVRITKWPADPNHVQQDNGNDYAFFRLGEMYLIRAEAENELGQTAAATADIHLIRARAFNPPKPIASGL